MAIHRTVTSWGTFFLKYIIAHSAVMCVIPATGNPAHTAEDFHRHQEIFRMRPQEEK
jgi:hypothetical protein